MKIATGSNKNPIIRVNFHNFVFNWRFNSLPAEFPGTESLLSPKDMNSCHEQVVAPSLDGTVKNWVDAHKSISTTLAPLG